MAEPTNRYWLSLNAGETWREVTEDEWCNMERQCGFRGGRPATAGFGSHMIKGHMHYGWQEGHACDYGPCAS